MELQDFKDKGVTHIRVLNGVAEACNIYPDYDNKWLELEDLCSEFQFKAPSVKDGTYLIGQFKSEYYVKAPLSGQWIKVDKLIPSLNVEKESFIILSNPVASAEEILKQFPPTEFSSEFGYDYAWEEESVIQAMEEYANIKVKEALSK